MNDEEYKRMIRGASRVPSRKSTGGQNNHGTFSVKTGIITLRCCLVHGMVLGSNNEWRCMADSVKTAIIAESFIPEEKRRYSLKGAQCLQCEKDSQQVEAIKLELSDKR